MQCIHFLINLLAVLSKTSNPKISWAEFPMRKVWIFSKSKRQAFIRARRSSLDLSRIQAIAGSRCRSIVSIPRYRSFVIFYSAWYMYHNIVIIFLFFFEISLKILENWNSKIWLGFKWKIATYSQLYDRVSS